MKNTSDTTKIKLIYSKRFFNKLRVINSLNNYFVCFINKSNTKVQKIPPICFIIKSSPEVYLPFLYN